LKNMNRNRKNGIGFTLIEALVAVFVIGTISAMMIVNWRKNEGQYQLQRAAQEIVQIIRKAQDFALNGSRMFWEPTDEMTVPESYGVHIEEGNPIYFIYGDMGGNAGYQNPEDIEETRTQIETGIEIDSVSGDRLDVIFSIPDGFTSFYGVPSSTEEVTITVRKTGKTCPSVYCRNIIVRKIGEISIE
jgi:type II secretory pathway pseudopilin PulG